MVIPCRLALLFFLVSLPLRAEMTGNFAAGMNLGFGSAQPTQPGSTRNALAVQLGVDLRLTKHWYVSPGLAFVQRGVQTTLYTYSTYNVNGDVRLDYLELPLLIKAKWSLGQRWRLVFLLGPTAALLLKREVSVMDIVAVDLSNRFSSMDLLFQLGAGLEYSLGARQALTFQLRHARGLMDIDTTDRTFYTRGYQILLGFNMDF